MITFKEFLAEDNVYYSLYDEMRTSKVAIQKFKERMGEAFGISARRIVIIPLIAGPVTRFKFDVSFGKKEDYELMGPLMVNLAKKDLQGSFSKVTVKNGPEYFKGSNGVQRALFSILVQGEQK
jgi:hypothetical protein